MRSNTFESASALWPDKGTYRKIEEQNGKTIDDLSAGYNAFLSDAKTQFDSVILSIKSWEGNKYLHTTVETVKIGNVPTAKVTVKFDSAGEPNKFSFTSIKFNNRWYILGDLVWIAKGQ